MGSAMPITAKGIKRAAARHVKIMKMVRAASKTTITTTNTCYDDSYPS